MKIGIVDIETVGFKPSSPIIEIGIVELDLESGKTKVLYDSLVKEPSFCEEYKGAWVFENSSLEFEDILKAKDIEFEVLQEIFDKYYMTAFNKKFDFGFLKYRGFKIKELDCPMLLSTNVCKIKGKFGKNKWPKVEEAWKYFFPEIEYVEEHRGCDDAKHEALIVHKLYEMDVFKVPVQGE